MFKKMYDFNESVGLPTSIADVEIEEKDLPAVIKKTLEMPDADHNPYEVTEEMLVDAFDKLSNYNKTKTLLED